MGKEWGLQGNLEFTVIIDAVKSTFLELNIKSHTHMIHNSMLEMSPYQLLTWDKVT